MRVLCICVWLGLAASLAAQTGGQEPEGLLARIKAHVGESLKRLPSYTCLETVERFERRGASAPFVLADRLRLEVAMVGNKEFYAWPGDSKFEEKSIVQMIPSGTIGSGDFALHAYAVFLSRGPAYTYVGETTRNGRRLIRFDYRVGESDSGYTLRVPPREAQVGYYGSFLVDRETLDLVRLEVAAADIPPDLGLTEAVDAMEYARVRIGDGLYTLPASSELLLKKPTDIESRNHLEFSRCRQFTGESRLTFGETTLADQPLTQPASAKEALPQAALFDLILETAIDSATSAVGDEVTARLGSDVKKGGTVLIPKGARVTGRITMLSRVPQPAPHFAVRLNFFTLEFSQRQADFTARLEAVMGLGGVSTYKTPAMRVPYAGNRDTFILLADAPPTPGVADLVVSGVRAELPRGLHLIWRTTDKEGDARP
jgi:hypothetical protein